MPFQINYIPLELLRNNQPVRNLIWKCRFPDFEAFWGGMLTHDFDDIGRCDCGSIWESFQKSTDPKPMVSMTMCNVDGCQVLTFSNNPVCQGVGLRDRHKGIYQDSVPYAKNESGCHRLKICLRYARRQVASDKRYARRHVHVPVQKCVV